MGGGRVSISAWMTSFISFISLSIHPNSWNTQISPAYFSIAIASSLSTDGHLFGLFSLFGLFGFPLPLPFPFPFLALVSAISLLEQVSIAAMVLSPNDEPALQIIIMCSSVKQNPFLSCFSSFPPFPPLPPFPPFPAFLAITETTAKERTKTRIKDLMVLLVVED